MDAGRIVENGSGIPRRPWSRLPDAQGADATGHTDYRDTEEVSFLTSVATECWGKPLHPGRFFVTPPGNILRRETNLTAIYI